MLNVSRLKPEIRLAQAVSQFEADLSSDQKATFRADRSRSRDSPPDLHDVMRLTASIDHQSSGKVGRGRCFGPRLTGFLQAVQQFAALGDVIVGGSQNLIACGVWTIVRMSLLSIVNFSTYLEKLSSILMAAGRSAPRYQTIALLYPLCEDLQSSLSEYFIVVVRLCHQVLKFTQKSALAQFAASLDDSDAQAYQSAFDFWANTIKDEVSVLTAKTINEEAQENSKFRSLSMRISKSAALRKRLQAKLRVLDSCSVYDYETTWKQTRKIGNTTLFNQTPEYPDWKGQETSCTLICTGKLGSGKSVLLANVVDDLNLESQSKNVTVAYFFCRHDIPESLRSQTIIGSLARQLLLQVADIATMTEFIDKTTSRALGLRKIRSLLRHAILPTSKAYFVLDGLDECDGVERDILISQLRSLQRTFSLLLCVSIRLGPGNVLKSSLEQLTATQIISIPDNNPDIETFISAELESLLESKTLVIGNPALILDIQDALLKGSQGMFLWVALQIGSLCDMQTDDAIRQALLDLPKDLPETLSRIIRKSEGPGKPYQRRILELLTIAQRPLTADELLEALSVVPGNTVWNPSRLINDIYLVLPCCGSLIMIDEEEKTIRLVHHSVKQFLLSEFKDSADIPITIDSATKTMAEIIITYLNYGVFGTQLSTMRVPQIAAASAPSQIIRATLDSSSSIRGVALKLLKSRKQPGFDIGKTLADAGNLFSPRSVHVFRFYRYATSHGLQHIMQVQYRQTNLARQNIEVHTSTVLGDGDVGKDELVKQFMIRRRLDISDPMIDEYYGRLAVLDDVQCMIHLADTSGQEYYTTLRDQWIRAGESFVLVYSIFSRASFYRIRKFHAQIRRVKTSLASPATNVYAVPIPYPIMLVAHDFHGKLEGERQVGETEGRSLATELGCDFTEASAKNETEVDKIFFDLVRKVRSHRAAVIHLSMSS